MVPGSVRVRLQAEEEGLDIIFKEAGGEWRGAGMLDVPGHESRPADAGRAKRVDVEPQLRGATGQGRSHPSASVPVAAATAIRGTLSAPTDLEEALTWSGLTSHTGVGVPLRRSNVDTDQIIPAVYLKRVTRTGFEDGLFAACARRPGLRPRRRGLCRGLGPRRRPGLRHRLVARARRVGAAELRVQSVISPRFADIFRGNSGKSGLVAAQVDEKVVQRLWDLLESQPGATVTVDLESRTIRAGEGPDAIEDSFDIDDYTRCRLLEGLDDIDITLSHDDDIATYESTRPTWKPATL